MWYPKVWTTSHLKSRWSPRIEHHAEGFIKRISTWIYSISTSMRTPGNLIEQIKRNGGTETTNKGETTRKEKNLTLSIEKHLRKYTTTSNPSSFLFPAFHTPQLPPGVAWRIFCHSDEWSLGATGQPRNVKWRSSTHWPSSQRSYGGLIETISPMVLLYFGFGKAE